jgi:hypothetical protein
VQISPVKYKFALNAEDMHSIREALRRWGKSEESVDGFNGSTLYRYFERWHQFVETDWTTWDQSEYNQDLDCRFWIQVAIEHSCPATRNDLELEVDFIDARFKACMKHAIEPSILVGTPLSQHPYFWESYTISS